ncbi:FAD/NAD(P)-binding domain-containing protein [Thozetella sp. PMI_491]|nr:FAD/NAD(P)-binding domain-containing protein [Thozetella sp. PMI_491]
MAESSSALEAVAKAEVIIVGAGLSGLQAAYTLQQAGVSCIVLEARDRVGGKLWSVPTDHGQGCIELGGAWINDVNQPHAMRLVKKFGLEMIEQNTNGDCIMEGYGRFAYGSDPRLPQADREALIRVRDGMEKFCHTIDLVRPGESLPVHGNLSVDALASSLGATEIVRRVVNIWTAAMLGMASRDVSAIYFLHYCHAGGGLLQMRSDAKGGGQHLRFRTGSQALASGLRDCLRPNTVIYSVEVDKIEQSLTGRCVVTTRSGQQFRAARVISTIPSPLLQRITFSPALSADKSWLAANGRLGFYAKVFLAYSAPWWRDLGLCGLTQGFSGPVSLTRDTSSDKDSMFTLACFIVGERGRAWATNSPEQRLADVLAHVDRIYGRTCPRPIFTKEQIWNNELFSMGAPCPVVPSSCLQSLGNDQWRPEGYLHFAGTETSPKWKGYMEGALESGERVAKEVMEQLGIDRASASPKL